MAESLRSLAEDLAEYFNQTVLDQDALTSHDVLDALASLGITLVEDPAADSTYTYYESLPKPVGEPEAEDR